MEEPVEDWPGNDDGWNCGDDPEQEDVPQAGAKNIRNGSWCRVRWQEGVGDVQSGSHRNPQVHQWHIQFPGDNKDNWQHYDQDDFKEEGQTDDEGGQDDGNLDPAPPKLVNQGRGNPVTTTGIGNQLAQHGTKTEDNCQVP